jgi:hypothetical protein
VREKVMLFASASTIVGAPVLASNVIGRGGAAGWRGMHELQPSDLSDFRIEELFRVVTRRAR